MERHHKFLYEQSYEIHAASCGLGTCSVCGIQDSKDNIRIHSEKIHGIKTEVHVQGRFICNLCKKVFDTEKMSEVHSRHCTGKQSTL